MCLEVLEHHSMQSPLRAWLINAYLLTSFHGPWKPLNWNTVPNYPLVIMVILPNGVWASYLDSLSGMGQQVAWDVRRSILNPGDSVHCPDKRCMCTMHLQSHHMRGLSRSPKPVCVEHTVHVINMRLFQERVWVQNATSMTRSSPRILNTYLLVSCQNDCSPAWWDH